MSALINGVLHDQWHDTQQHNGAFVRRFGGFRDWVTTDGSSIFPAEAHRYRLYASYADPWSHRALIARKLKGLDAVIAVSIVDPVAAPQHGWYFSERPGCVPDVANGFKYVHELYTTSDPHYTGRITVPILWDTVTRRIVNNESSDIMRMFNTAFDAYGKADVDFYPLALRNDIDRMQAFVHETINDGVYKTGFATQQWAYQEALGALFGALDKIEAHLAYHRYLLGNRITEADWRLFASLVRFDMIYHAYFRCNLRRLQDYNNLWNYARELYQWPGISETVNFDHMKMTYYNFASLNPTGIIPEGPSVNFCTPTATLRFKRYCAPLAQLRA